MSVSEQTWKLDELASETGISARTVRYYVQRGLLPAPVFRGRDTAYSEEHLIRLRAIRKLQDRFLPLDAIQAELARRSLDELRQLAHGHQPPSEPHATRVPPAPLPARPASHSWTRLEVAPGLEIHLSEGADAATRTLYQQLRTLCDPTMKGKK